MFAFVAIPESPRAARHRRAMTLLLIATCLLLASRLPLP
jgi:hypothetical protein